MGTVHKRAGMCNRNRFQTSLLARIEEQKHGSVLNTQFLGHYSMLNSNYLSILHQFEEKHLRGDLSSAYSAMFYCAFLFRYALFRKHHPGDLVGLARILGHESLDTTKICTQLTAEELAERVEHIPLNAYG